MNLIIILVAVTMLPALASVGRLLIRLLAQLIAASIVLAAVAAILLVAASHGRLI
jgi:hypothetical protein